MVIFSPPLLPFPFGCHLRLGISLEVCTVVSLIFVPLHLSALSSHENDGAGVEKVEHGEFSVFTKS